MTTKIKPTIPAKQLCIWLPIARHGANHDERRMPVPLPDIDTTAAQIERTPCERVFISEPFGADESLGRYQFSEYLAASMHTKWSRHLDWAYNLLEAIYDIGRTPVIYGGSPHTQLDLAWAPEFLGVEALGTEFAFDAASGEPAGGICHRVLTDHGGRERFWIEAHPPAEAKHWQGYRVCMLAQQRRQVESVRASETPAWTPIADDNHPTIAIMMTGHGRTSLTSDVRDAARWARQGHTIGLQLHEWDQWAERVDLGGEG